MDGKIAKWWMPDDVVFVNEIPHTATGKILKTALRDSSRTTACRVRRRAQAKARLGNLRHPRLARLPQREPLPMNVAVPVPPITPQIPLTARTPVAFAGERGDFFRLILRGSPLQVPTAGSTGSGSSPTSAGIFGARPSSAARASNTPAPGASLRSAS